METLIQRNFTKSLAKINDPVLSACVVKSLANVAVANSLSDIQNIKKLSGYKTAYRIKCGAYRIGIVFTGNILCFEEVAHRKDIYQRFP